MGILDDFIKNIKSQRDQYKEEQQHADTDKARKENEAKIKEAREREAAKTKKSDDVLEQARRENEAKIQEAREREAGGKGRPSDYGFVGEVAERMKEQRRQFEEASKGQKPAPKHAETSVVQEQKPLTVGQKPVDVVSAYGHTFTRPPGQDHLWIDDSSKAVYIDDVDEYRKAGGKVEQKDITAAMDPYMYEIYTKKGGPVGQARYYKAGGTVISLVPDPFKRYR